MDRDPRERIWPYILLVVSLLLLAIAAPRYWRWREAELAKQSQREEAPSDVDLLVNRVSVERNEQSILLAQAPALLEAVELPADETATGGAVAAYGPPVAGAVDGFTADEIPLPPEVWDDAPNLPVNIPQIDRVDLRLAMRLRMAARNEREQAVTVWPRPTALIEQLQAAQGDARCETWAGEVLSQLEALGSVEATDSQQSKQILNRLAQLADEVPEFVLQVRPWQLQLHMASAAQGLRRRVAIWQQVQKLADAEEPTQPVSSVTNEEIRRRANEAIATIDTESARHAWANYLLLNELREAVRNSHADPETRAMYARAVLERMHSPRLDARQRNLFDTPAMHKFDRVLQQAATEPIDTVEVIYAIEQYENTQAQNDAARLAAAAAQMRWSSHTGVAELARRVDENYRGMNVRTAITSQLLNRLVPQEETKHEDVDEYILGSYVEGQRTIQTDLAVRLIPDDDEWRLGMEARGTMSSDTVSYAGNANIFTQGTGRFAARKLIVVDHHLVHVWPAAANVRYEGELTGVSTNLDRLPIVNRFARSQAVDGYYESQWAAQQQVEARLKERATELLDRQTDEPLREGTSQLQRHLLKPLARASVQPTALKMFTTEDRLTGTWRFAGGNQLGAHTSRPWAPLGSLLSVQVHESAINNTLAGLKFEGREATVRAFCQEMHGLFGMENSLDPLDLPEGMIIRFADEEAMRVRFADGQMEVILQIAELQTERKTWRDLTVRNFYAPDPSTLSARLVRDSSVRLKGERLGIRDQVALRGIFTKLFSNNDELPLIPDELAKRPELADLTIVQFVVRDGWVGVAIGPHASRTTVGEGDDTPLDRQARWPRDAVR